MIKNIKILFFSFLALVFASTAKADNDFLELTLAKIRNTLTQATYLREQVTNAQNDLNATRQGLGKAMKDITKLDQFVDEASKVTTVPSFVDVNNPAESASKLGEATTPKLSEGDTTRITAQKDEEIQALQREVVSSLYAVAYVMRYNLTQEEPKEPDMTDRRTIIKSCNEKAMSISRRLARISTLEATTYEFKASQKLKTFKDYSKSEEGE